jgi:hypothetical protein
MANVLTALAPTLFAAARIVPKELTGFMGACTRDFADQGVAQGGTVKVTVAPRLTVASIPTPGMTFAAGSDRTPSTIDLALNQTAQVTWNLTGEQERQLMLGGTAQDLFKQTVENGFRSLRNQIEAYVGTTAKNAASRAIGTAGSNPFASDFNFIADNKKILDDNGAGGDRGLIIDTTAGSGLRKLSALYKVNEAGDGGDLLRQGVLGRLHDFDIRESAGVASHTKGTMTGALVNNAAAAIGDTTIPYDTGTPGATGIVAGDCITIAGDTNVYVVKTGPGAAASGNIVIQEPGLKVAVADNAAITVGNSYTGNIAMTRASVVTVVRPIIQPDGPIAEQSIVTDEATKFSCLMLRVVGDQMASYYMRCVYDAFAPNPYGISTLRG